MNLVRNCDFSLFIFEPDITLGLKYKYSSVRIQEGGGKRGCTSRLSVFRLVLGGVS